MSEPEKIATKRPRRMARQPRADVNVGQELAATTEPSDPPETTARANRPQTKADLILDLLRREEGATLEQLVAATGWLSHTTRAALTGIKRKGHVLSSEKIDGVRTYRIVTTGSAR